MLEEEGAEFAGVPCSGPTSGLNNVRREKQGRYGKRTAVEALQWQLTCYSILLPIQFPTELHPSDGQEPRNVLLTC